MDDSVCQLSTEGSKPDPSKEIAITNRSDGEVVVLMPTLPNPTKGGGIQVYNQDIEELTSIAGKQTISKSSTETFVLDQYFTDPKTGKKKYSTIYNLLVSTSNWYEPVDNIGVIQLLGKYAPQTITAEEASSLRNAATFYQTISAYPTSALTKNYQKAMAGTVNAAGKAADGSPDSSDNVANAVSSGADAFFKGTKTFKNVTLAGVVATESYYRAFPFVWAKFATTTYYLYSSDGKETSFVGSIALAKPISLDITKANGGYSCTFSPAVTPSDTTSVAVDTSKSKDLTYSDGLFVDAVDVDIPQIAVKGTFQVKRFFTQKPSDTQVIPVLTGSIDGSTVIGFDAPQKSDDKSGSEFWNSLFHPKNSAQIFKAVMTLGGALMMLVFFGQVAYGVYRLARGLGAAKEPSTADLLKSQQEAFERILNEKIDAAVKKISDGQQQAPKDPDAAARDVVEQRDIVADNQVAGNIEDGLNSEAESLQELAQYESRMDVSQIEQLQSVASDLDSSQAALGDATPETLSQVVSDQTTAFDGIRGDVSSLTTELETVLSEDARANIADNAATSERLSQDIEDSSRNASEDESNEDPDLEDGIFPE